MSTGLDLAQLVDEHRGLIYNVVGKWRRLSQTKDLFEDTLADGYYFFVVAVRDFDPALNIPLTGWIIRRIFYGLAEEFRRKANRHRILKQHGPASIPSILAPDYTYLKDTVADLSQEAQRVVNFIFNTPEEFEKLIQESRSHTRVAVWQAVKDQFDWPGALVGRAFKEIQEAFGL